MNFSRVSTIAIVVLAFTAAGQLGRERYLVYQTTDIAARDVVLSDTLTDPSLRMMAMNGEKRVRLSSLLSSPCTVLIMYESHCPACEKLAPLWSGRDSLGLGSEAAPVRWIDVNNVDEGGDAFVKRHELPGPPAFFLSRREVRTFGIASWPQIWVVDRARRLIAAGARSPEAVQKQLAICMKA